MSIKGDDVLDDWEEIDEDGINTKLDKLKKTKMNTSQNIVGPVNVMMLARASTANSDDDYRQQYGPQEPTVKILKRPTQLNGGNRTGSSFSGNSHGGLNNDNKPKQPMKTLKQREQEYAEARLRILGSAKNPKEDEQNIIKYDLYETVTNNICYNGGSSSSGNLNGQNLQKGPIKIQDKNLLLGNQLGQQQQQQQQDNILRMPRGPNGPGFLMKR